MADTAPPQDEPKPRLPIELCERVIDEVYEDDYYQAPTALATLSRCALVCRAWRAPAQKVLFEYVILRDKDAIYRFAELLDATPELGAYVRQVDLRGYLNVPNSSVVSFPAVLGARLTNLTQLYLYEFDQKEKVAHPLPDDVKELRALPIHRLYLPSLGSISHIRIMHLDDVVLPSFGDFARILNTLSNLQELSCDKVSWVVHGQEPLCMANHSSQGSEQTFLPNLKAFECFDMDERGRQRLLGALGPSLRRLELKFPNDALLVQNKPFIEAENESSALNLQSFHHLDSLIFDLAPFQVQYGGTLESLRETLLSWVTSDECDLGYYRPVLQPQPRTFYLEPHIRYYFTRKAFVELLRVIGSVVEAALCSEHVGDSKNDAGGDIENQVEPCQVTVVVRNLGDRLEWTNWWETRIQECFPTCMKWGRLDVYPCHVSDAHKWRDQEQTPDNLPHTPSPELPSITADSPANAVEL